MNIVFYMKFNSKSKLAESNKELKALLNDFISNISVVKRIPLTAQKELVKIISADTHSNSQKH